MERFAKAVSVFLIMGIAVIFVFTVRMVVADQEISKRSTEELRKHSEQVKAAADIARAFAAGMNAAAEAADPSKPPAPVKASCSVVCYVDAETKKPYIVLVWWDKNGKTQQTRVDSDQQADVTGENMLVTVSAK